MLFVFLLPLMLVNKAYHLAVLIAQTVPSNRTPTNFFRDPTFWKVFIWLWTLFLHHCASLL